MRLIDADLLEDQFGISDEDLLALDEIRHAPTVDAVVVTRCKDCKHYRNHPNGLCYLHTESKANARGYSGDAVCVEPDDFCSYGERREE
jgi:hypothetical protein